MREVKTAPGRYYEIIHGYQEAQLLFAAIRMNVFSCLDEPQTAQAVAAAVGCEEQAMDLLLLTLVQCGLLEQREGRYVNTAQAREFLSRNSDVFLGDALLFRESMTSLSDLEEKLRGQAPPAAHSYDFAYLARMAVPEMYAGRVQAFADEMGKLFPEAEKPLRLLDLGGGSGVLAIEFARRFPKSHGVVFEIPPVAQVAREMVEENRMEDRVEMRCGDFNQDDFGGPYDLVIASGILNFVKGGLDRFLKRIADALTEGGYLLIVGQREDSERNLPGNLLSWLSGFLSGTPFPSSEAELAEALEKADLSLADRFEDSLFEERLYRKGRAALVCSGDVVRSFIELTERIANSRTNVLDFGSEDMTFYRGEIHMIKMIGDFPGIHSAELARKFGITRPVVHRTLAKLDERGFVVKEGDPADGKRFKLTLTEKGRSAYRLHEKYHDDYDKELFAFLADASEEELAAMKGFLEHAIGVIQNHA